MNYKERLREYVENDEIYTEYKSGKYDMSDFDKFCIEHCKDIECLLNENEEQKEVIDKTIEYIEKDMWNTLDDGNTSCYVIERAEEELLSILKEVGNEKL